LGDSSASDLSPNVCVHKFEDDLGSLFATIQTSIMSGKPVEVLVLHLVGENVKKKMNHVSCVSRKLPNVLQSTSNAKLQNF
jgi:hypothetical protein